MGSVAKRYLSCNVTYKLFTIRSWTTVIDLMIIDYPYSFRVFAIKLWSSVIDYLYANLLIFLTITLQSILVHHSLPLERGLTNQWSGHLSRDQTPLISTVGITLMLTGITVSPLTPELLQ